MLVAELAVTAHVLRKKVLPRANFDGGAAHLQLEAYLDQLAQIGQGGNHGALPVLVCTFSSFDFMGGGAGEK
jgi:hypothetical protein